MNRDGEGRLGGPSPLPGLVAEQGTKRGEDFRRQLSEACRKL